MKSFSGDTDPSSVPNRPPENARKKYAKPGLVVYGDLGTITRNVGMTSQKNDPGDGSLKTA